MWNWLFLLPTVAGFSVVLPFKVHDLERLQVTAKTLERFLKVSDLDDFLLLSPCDIKFMAAQAGQCGLMDDDDEDDSGFQNRLAANDFRLDKIYGENCHKSLFHFVPAERFQHVCAESVVCGDTECDLGLEEGQFVDHDRLLRLARLGAAAKIHSPNVLLLDADTFAMGPLSKRTLETSTGVRVLKGSCASLEEDEMEYGDTGYRAALDTLHRIYETRAQKKEQKIGVPKAPPKLGVCRLGGMPQVLRSDIVRSLLTDLEAEQPWYRALYDEGIVDHAWYSAYVATHWHKFQNDHDFSDVQRRRESGNGAIVEMHSRDYSGGGNEEDLLATASAKMVAWATAGALRQKLFLQCPTHQYYDPKEDPNYGHDEERTSFSFEECKLLASQAAEGRGRRPSVVATFIAVSTDPIVDSRVEYAYSNVLFLRGHASQQAPWVLLVVIFYVLPAFLGCLYATQRFINFFLTLILPDDVPGRILEVPSVTVQICCYNEAEVIEKTIDAACSLEWPRDKLIVQVLDDSTDPLCTQIAEATCRKWHSSNGLNVTRKSRPNRRGYKAGNLAYHHENSLTTEFVAFFDADHRPHPQFLKKTMPHFFDRCGSQNRVGLVQCPWGYYNRTSCLLTEVDALCLDAAFVIEQDVRTRRFGFLSFNGTGGVWRKTAIEAGGGWACDTVTEDLDLSYRTYIAGYTMRFVRDLVCELEVPATFKAFKSQKHRWTKGYFQVTAKSLGYFLLHRDLNFGIKLEAIFHLTGATQYSVALAGVILIPILAYFRLVNGLVIWFSLYPAIIWCFVAVATVFRKHGYTFRERCRRLLFIPASLALALGMSVQESLAIFEGLVSTDATFIRTVKQGAADIEVGGKKKSDVDDTKSTQPVLRCLCGLLEIPVPRQETIKSLARAGELLMLFYTTASAIFLTYHSFYNEDLTAHEVIQASISSLALSGFAWVVFG